jgi:hypothetical protein
MELKNLETELAIVGQFMENILSAQIVYAKKVASGALLNSVESKTVKTFGGYASELYAANYVDFVSSGRKAGFPNGGDGSFLKALIEWVKVKGIESDDRKARSAAWAIRNAIFKRGIPPTNIIEFAIEEINKQIDDMVREALTKDIEAAFDKAIMR